MQLEFLQQLDEGRALNRTKQLDRLDVEEILRLLFLELGAVVLFQHEHAAQVYAKTTLDGGAFHRWRMFGTDLYNAATALNSSEYRSRLNVSRGVINVPLLQKILRDAAAGHAKSTDYAKFTLDAQRSFDVSSSILGGIRRRVGDFEHLNDDQKKMLLSDMGRYYAPYGNKSDMLSISVDKSHASPVKSFLGWALKMAAIGYASYHFGKSLVK